MERLRRWFVGPEAPLRPFADALLTAGILVLSAPGVGPAPFALLAWVAFAPILRHLPLVSPARAALLGWLAGVALTLGACAWFPGLLARFSTLSPALAVGATLAIAAYQGLGWAAWGVIVRTASPVLPVALVAPAAFVALERWMPAIFPSSVGMTQYRVLPLIQVVELGGPYVLTFLCLLVGAVLAETGRRRRARRPFPWRAISGASAAIAFALLFGLLRLRQVEADRAVAPTLRVAAVQADVVRTGWTRLPDDPGALARYQRLSAAVERSAGPVDLLIWPEKAYPRLLRRDAQHDYREDHPGRIRRGFVSPLLFGATSVDPSTRELGNSAFLLAPDGTLRDVYDKVRLIFFSEHLPSWLQRWGGGGMRYRPGTAFEPVRLEPADLVGGRSVMFSVFICFEATFPDHVRALAAGAPQLLVNISDDSWFGDTAEPEQHLAQAVFRAVESRRDLVRATASGISAILGATGRIEQRTRLTRNLAEADVVLVGTVHLLSRGGPYAIAGDLFAGWCVLVVLAAIGLAVGRSLGARTASRLGS